MAKRDFPYNSRLQKGGALLDDMRALVRLWSNHGNVEVKREEIIHRNLLAKHSRGRVIETLRRAYLPRFVYGDPPEAWRIVKALEDRNLPPEVLRPVYYWITARTERLLYDYVTEELHGRYGSDGAVSTQDVTGWIQLKLKKYDRRWSDTVCMKVARGMLAALRDFGILEGKAKKSIAAVHQPDEAFAMIAFALYHQGHSALALVNHADWKLFLLSSSEVERKFLQADRRGLLSYQAAGEIVRVEFPAKSYGEMADVIYSKSH